MISSFSSLQSLISLLLLSCQFSIILASTIPSNEIYKHLRLCTLQGCEFPGFIGPWAPITYSDTRIIFAYVPTALPWQVDYIDTTCGDSEVTITICNSSNTNCQSFPLTSTSGSPQNYASIADAQADPNCGNSIRSFRNIGPSIFNPNYSPTVFTVPTDYRLEIVVTGGTSTGNGYIRISPFYGVTCGGISDFSGDLYIFVLPMTAWITLPDGYQIRRVCESRGMFLNEGEGTGDNIIGAFNSCPYASARILYQLADPDDPTNPNVCVGTNGFVDADFTGPSCAELDPTFGIMTVSCRVPPNYGSLPT